MVSLPVADAVSSVKASLTNFATISCQEFTGQDHGSITMDVQSNQKERIKVTQVSQQFLVWSSQDVVRLRKEFRMIGSFIGVKELTLPLKLSRFEMKILLEENAVRVERCLTSSEVDPISLQDRKKLFEEQLKEEVEANRLRVLEEKETIIGKNLHALVMKHSQRNPKEEDEDQIFENTMQRERAKQHTIPVTFTFESRNEFAEEVDLEIINEVLQPKSLLEELKFLVFKDFWSKDLFVTSGFKFACDFLVYEKDPFVCHATFMIICRPDDTSPILESTNTITEGRLSVSVNKQVLYASFKDTNDRSKGIAYRMLTWQ